MQFTAVPKAESVQSLCIACTNMWRGNMDDNKGTREAKDHPACDGTKIYRRNSEIGRQHSGSENKQG